MARCNFCGEPAGLFRNAHPECARFEEQVIDAIRRAADAPTICGLQSDLAGLRVYAPMSHERQQQSVFEGWKSIAEDMLSDGYLDEAEQAKLSELAHACNLTVEGLRETEVFWRIAKAAIIRQILHGVIPERSLEDMPFTLNLQRDETVVWVFEDAALLEDRTYRHHVGRSQGVSVRIASGVYYRTGTYKGEPIDVEKRVHVDDGTVIITDQHIHFVGNSRSFRVPYAKIVSFQQYSDGIGVMKDGASARQQTFVVGDGWFAYNLVTNLSAMAR